MTVYNRCMSLFVGGSPTGYRLLDLTTSVVVDVGVPNATFVLAKDFSQAWDGSYFYCAWEQNNPFNWTLYQVDPGTGLYTGKSWYIGPTPTAVSSFIAGAICDGHYYFALFYDASGRNYLLIYDLSTSTLISWTQLATFTGTLPGMVAWDYANNIYIAAGGSLYVLNRITLALTTNSIAGSTNANTNFLGVCYDQGILYGQFTDIGYCTGSIVGGVCTFTPVVPTQAGFFNNTVIGSSTLYASGLLLRNNGQAGGLRTCNVITGVLGSTIGPNIDCNGVGCYTAQITPAFVVQYPTGSPLADNESIGNVISGVPQVVELQVYSSFAASECYVSAIPPTSGVDLSSKLLFSTTGNAPWTSQVNLGALLAGSTTPFWVQISIPPATFPGVYLGAIVASQSSTN